jgi:hypothetical protein
MSEGSRIKPSSPFRAPPTKNWDLPIWNHPFTTLFISHKRGPVPEGPGVPRQRWTAQLGNTSEVRDRRFAPTQHRKDASVGEPQGEEEKATVAVASSEDGARGNQEAGNA